jgi:hypothetical protein
VRQLLFLVGLGIEGGQQGVAIPGGGILTAARADRSSGMEIRGQGNPGTAYLFLEIRGQHTYFLVAQDG